MTSPRRILRTLTAAVVAVVAGVAVDAIPAAAAPKANVIAITPHRMYDSREHHMLNTGEERGFAVTGRGNVPQGVAAVVLNVTVTQPIDYGHLTVWPCDQPRPNASTVNYAPGETVANLAITAVDETGFVCVYTHAAAHIVIDANGYLPTNSGYQPVIPGRLADTRPGATTVDGHLQRGGKTRTLTVDVTGRANVANTGVTSAVVNLTVTQPDAAGYLTAHPCNTKAPNASNVNYLAGQTRANAAIVKLDTAGRFCVTSSATADIIVDVTGTFSEQADGVTTITPARLTDTRAAHTTIDGKEQSAGRVRAGTGRRVQITGRGNVPKGATAAILNVTAVFPQAAGYLTVHPCGKLPTASNVNYLAGGVVPNAVIARLDDNGGTCIYTSATADIVVDVAGHIIGPPPPPDWDYDGAPITNLQVTPGCWLDGADSTAWHVVSFTPTWEEESEHGHPGDVELPEGWDFIVVLMGSNDDIIIGGPTVPWTPPEPWMSPETTTVTILGVSYTIYHGSQPCTVLP